MISENINVSVETVFFAGTVSLTNVFIVVIYAIVIVMNCPFFSFKFILIIACLFYRKIRGTKRSGMCDDSRGLVGGLSPIEKM